MHLSPQTSCPRQNLKITPERNFQTRCQNERKINILVEESGTMLEEMNMCIKHCVHCFTLTSRMVFLFGLRTWLVAGGRWAVAGGWWPVAGGWWLVSSGRWGLVGVGRSVVACAGFTATSTHVL